MIDQHENARPHFTPYCLLHTLHAHPAVCDFNLYCDPLLEETEIAR